MKKVLSIIFVVMLMVSVFAACSKDKSGDTTASGSVKGDAPALTGGTLIEKQKNMMDQMITILEGAGGNAEKAAAGMAAYYAKNKSAIEVMQKEAVKFQDEVKKDPGKAMAALKDMKPLMTKAMKLGKLMRKYQNDPKFMALIGKMQINSSAK